LPEQREAVAFLREQGLSERRACTLVGVNRASLQYKARSNHDADLQGRLHEFARKHPRWGVRKAYWIVRREQPSVNHKRIQRLWTRAGLQVRPRKRDVYKPPRPQPLLVTPTRPGEVWSVDFVTDATETGGKLRILSVGDDFTRECLAVEVATAFPAARVLRVLARLLAERSAPVYVKSDNGPEFIETNLTAWLSTNGVVSAYTEPGHPWQNGVRESFHSRLRDELLDGSAFASVPDAQAQIEAWRVVYNEVRPHQSLNGLTPHEYKMQWRQTPSPTEED
jgi:putative transposase